MTVAARDDGPVRYLSIDRAERLNAVDAATLDLLAEAVTTADADSRVRAVVLSGVGRAFCSGGDLDVEDPLAVANTERTADAAASCITAMIDSGTPLIAAVGGPAVGIGVSLALAADLAVAHEQAFFMLPFTSIGLMPDGGATALVAASVGRSRALQWALLGDRITAAEALASGLIAAVATGDELPATVSALAHRLAALPAEAVACTKHAITAAILPELDDVLARERSGQIRLTTTDEFRDAIAAFTARR